MVNKRGLYIINEDGYNVLMYEGRRISATRAGRKISTGLYIDGGHLEMSGSPIADTAASYPKIKAKNGEVYFGNIRLTTSGECVNITESDYNSLIAGERVSGYLVYSPSTVYNIVDNPLTSPVITYAAVGDELVFSSGITVPIGSSMVYNSVSGELTENTEDLTETIGNTACPYVHVRYFNPVINVGDTITLEYFVDTRFFSSVNYDTLHDTFTFIVKTGNSVVKKTTYAGLYSITTPQFNTTGINWFSVRCIDSNGVGSEEQFFDVMVKQPSTESVYTMKASDLEEFTIVPNDDTVSTAYTNKAALTAFFAKVKNDGYDRVVMYNNKSDNDGEGTIYWLDYHGVFGTQRYFMCGVANKVITSVEEITENDLPEYWSSHSTSSVPKVGDTCNTTDATYYYVINTSNSSGHVQFPSYFTVDLNGSTIAATQSTDLGGGELITFNNNTDTHLVNGSVRGNAAGFDFTTSRKRSGGSTEWLSVVSMSASKYCSFEKLDVSGAEGFDAVLGAQATNYGTWLSQVGLYGNSSIDLSTGETVTATNMVRSGSFGVSEGEIISFGRNGYNMYLDMGPERELFFAFYGSGDTYLGYIKTHFYHLVRVPVGATTMKFVGYGNVAASEDAAGDTDWKPSSSRGTLMLFRPQLCRNILIKDCHWHDTRTTAITNMIARGVLLENCTYKNIAIGDPIGGVVTPLLGDLEDSWQWASNITIKDCEWIQSSGHQEIKVYYANSFDFINNKGFDFIDGGGIKSGVFENNTVQGFSINRNRFCYFPSVVYRNNKLSWLNVNYGLSGTEAVNWTHKRAERIVTMVDTLIGVENHYADLHLKRCKNGLKIID